MAKQPLLVAGYFHLESLLVKAGDTVEPGQPVGHVGHNPRVSDPRHLHFEIQRVMRPKYRPINPRPFIETAEHSPTAGRYVWPVPPLPNSGLVVDGVVMDGRVPGISSGHKDDNPSRATHNGVDIMYPRRDDDAQKAGNGAGAKRWVFPQGVSAVAVGYGTVVEVGRIPTGLRCWIALEPPRGVSKTLLGALGIAGLGAGVAGYLFAQRKKR